jgi:curved DNA-binding protein CbpA
MPTDLYDILEVQADATPEQSVFLFDVITPPSQNLLSVRKAYKKRALQTHPDRAPAQQKVQAEERFRQVLPSLFWTPDRLLI